MPPIKELCFSQLNYPFTDYVSNWIYVADVESLTFSFYCDNNCDLTFDYSIDEQHEVIYTENYSIIAGEALNFIQKPIKTRYIRITIYNITIFSMLFSQGFYHS